MLFNSVIHCIPLFVKNQFSRCQVQPVISAKNKRLIGTSVPTCVEVVSLRLGKRREHHKMLSYHLTHCTWQSDTLYSAVRYLVLLSFLQPTAPLTSEWTHRRGWGLAQLDCKSLTAEAPFHFLSLLFCCCLCLFVFHLPQYRIRRHSRPRVQDSLLMHPGATVACFCSLGFLRAQRRCCQ